MYEVAESKINNVFTLNVYYKKVNHRLPLISHAQRARRYIMAHFEGWRIIKQKFGKPDIIHHNILYPAGVFALLLKWLYGYTYIVSDHSTEYLLSAGAKFSFVRKIAGPLIAKGAWCITTVSANLMNSMISKGIKAPYKIVNNVVNTHIFTPANSLPARKKHKLIHISTLAERQKNISGLLRTLARLAAQRNDFECLFIGEGDPANHIKLAKELGIYTTHVSFEAVKTTKAIAETMKNADALFLFSNYENMPVVVAEALACGIPVLSSNVGGINEHICEENGLLVPAGDEEALLKAFNTLLNNLAEKKYNAAALHDYAVKNFSYEEVSKKFHDIYSDALKHV